MLTRKVVLITGAARGIGAAAARSCAARGASVALVGLEPEELERTAAALGPDAAWWEADVTDADALAAVAEAVAERFGGIDAVVANAGIGGGGSILQSDPAAFERILEVNLFGVWRTIRATLPYVVERRGYVLPVASMAALAWSGGMGPYNASKAGTEALGRTLRAEVAHLGVEVGVAYFSWIDTDLVRGADAHPVGGALRGKLRGPMAKTYPVALTGEAIADGIERRRRTVVVPGWVRPLLAVRGLIQPVVEYAAMRHGRELLARERADVEQRGAEAASAPVGPGGAAAMGERVAG